MASPRPLAAVLTALTLALTGGTVAAADGTGAEALTPAPPPATYCRVAPDAGWPEIGPGPAADLTGYQDYRAGLGIPAGATGSGVDVADVEYEWSTTHADLASRALPPSGPSGLDPAFRVRDHGTAVLGILGAADDGHGVTGLVPAATLKPVSPIFPSLVSPYQPATAIADAGASLGPGDVMLIELQSLVPDGTDTLLGPIEYYESVRDAIATVVAKGVVVVEPSGNGDLDVGTLGRSWLSETRASGALMVGAGGSGIGETAVPDRQRVPGSNWGARVDVQGYGSAVVSSGYGDLSATGAGPDNAYTACFDGTSSASATVAGAVAALQAGLVAGGRAPLTPSQVRDVLRSTGLAQVATPGIDVSAENIGPRPQVSAALAALLAGPPPSSPADGAVAAPAAGATPEVTPTPAPLTSGPGSGAVTAGRSARSPAATGLAIHLDRAHHRLTVRLRGAARSALVRVGPRRVALRRGVLVLRGVRPGRIVVRVAAGGGYRAVAFRITVPVNGAARVARIP